MKKIFSTFLNLFLVLFILGQVVYASESINIFTTNDIHGNVEATETNIGMAQTAAIAASNDNALLIDAGDATQGASFASATQGEDVIKLMNAAGYDVMALGNHEFDYGVDQLNKNINLANFSILSANVTKDGHPLVSPSTVIEIGSRKIGVIGLTTTSTATSTNPSKLSGIAFGDEIKAAKEQIANLNNADTIIIVSHLGDNAAAVSCTSQKLLDGLNDSELKKVGALVDGHSHTVEDTFYTRDNVKIPIVQTGCYLTKVGHLGLNFSDNGDVSTTVELIDYDSAKNYKLNDNGKKTLDQVNSTLDEIKDSQSKVLDQVICENAMPLWGGYIYYDYAEPRIVETNYGDFVTDAFREKGEEFTSNNQISLPVIGVENGGGISATLNSGKVKRGDILNAFNHGNMVEAIKLSPAELFKALESGLVVTGQDAQGTLQRERVSGSFAQVSGLKYTYDPTGKEGNKITEVTLDNGTLLDREDTNKSIVMVTNSYVASAFPEALKLGELGGEDMIIEEFLLKQTNNGTTPLNVDITANRIQLENDKSPQEYSVSIPITDDSEDAKILPNTEVNLSIDGGTTKTYRSDKDGNILVTLERGPHTLIALESNSPVYVNNYSGSGTITTKPGYYKLGFTIDPNRIPTESVSFNQTSPILLTTKDSGNSTTISALVSPDNTTDTLHWSSSDPEILQVTPNGTSAKITALTEGETQITVQSGNKKANLTVLVSNQPLVIDQLETKADDYDHFSVTLKNVRANPFISSEEKIGDISLYAWSNSDQSDITAVHPQRIDGTNDWTYTFSINDTPINNYFNNASAIKIHAYGNLQNDSTQLLKTSTFDYTDNGLNNEILITPYAQNIGFITPTAIENTIAGTVGENRHLEGIRIASPIKGLEVNYSVHAQDIGWMNPVTSGVYAGTMRENRQIEAIQITLSGDEAHNYSIEYQVHAQNIGWMDPVSDGEIAGTTGENRQIEAIRIQLVKK